MARFKRCTEKDISILLDTSSESEIGEFDESFTPRKNKDVNSSDTSSSESIYNSNKSLLLQNNALRKEQASLRLKLRRSTEQSIYKIDTDSEPERPKRTTRSAKNLKKLQDENKMPRVRAIKLPKRYSEYKCVLDKSPAHLVRKEQINYNEKELLLASLSTTPNDRKKEAKKHTIKNNNSDSDCICVNVFTKSKSASSNPLSKSNKRSYVASIENNDSDTIPRVTRSSKRKLLNEEAKRNNVDKIDKVDDVDKVDDIDKVDDVDRVDNVDKMDNADKVDDVDKVLPNEPKTSIVSNTNTVQYSLDSTPKRRPRFGRHIINSLSASNKCKPRTLEDENEDEIDEVIYKVAKDLSIKTRKNRDIKNIESPIVNNGLSTPKARASMKHSALTPSVKMRTEALAKPVTPLQEVRSRLHISAVPKSLPCREEEFNNIYTFLEGKLTDNRGGCIYISGVPGTGKTATVNEVIKCLKRSVEKGKLQHFDFVEINGMKLSEPRQAYVQILKQLSGKVLTWGQAHNTLEKIFNSKAKRPMTLLLVDELDLLCTKRQDVVYNLLDWPTKISARLIVITIANTMDLPERALMGRVTSRLGLTRVSFQPYNHKQLQEIVVTRLKDSDVFKNEAIQLIARKVSAVSGDARRALDICRRAAEITETRDGAAVSMKDVTQALSEMMTNPKVQAIRHCSRLEQAFLQAICTEATRTGVEEVCFRNVYRQLEALCVFDGIQTPNISEAIGICARLGSSRLLICEDSRNDIHQRILLNVSRDDIHYALQKMERKDLD